MGMRKTISSFVFFFVVLAFSSSNSNSLVFARDYAVNPGAGVSASITKGADDLKLENKKSTDSAKKEDSENEFEAKRTELRQAFQEKLKIVRDEKKKTRVERLEAQMNEINKKRTDEMLKNLNKMQALLARIEEIAKELLDKFGVKINLTNYTAASKNAASAIAAAQAAVQAQANKIYTPNIVSEAALRVTVGQNVSQLQADLRAVREKVLAAKKALIDVYLALAKARNAAIPVTPTASPSGTTQ